MAADEDVFSGCTPYLSAAFDAIDHDILFDQELANTFLRGHIRVMLEG